MNRVYLCGRLGNPAELKTVGESKVATFSMATTEYGKDKTGNSVEYTEWHSVEAWGKLAENLVKYTAKGSEVLVDGSLKTDTWKDADGKSKFKTKIRAHNIKWFGSKATETAQQPQDQTPPPTVDLKDIPF